MWGNLHDQRKIAFFNAIKSEETAQIYKEYLKMDEIFISNKFKEKNNTRHRRIGKKSTQN